jgi:hypothetical protein
VEDQDNTAWKLLWALVGMVAFTVVAYYFGLIRTSENSVKAKFAPPRSGGPTLDVCCVD